MWSRTSCFLVATFSCAGTAFAQSSVTLYGVISGNVSYVSNAQTHAQSPSGRPVGHSEVAQFEGAGTALGASRWGLRGTEDLGGGLKAIFTMEDGFSMNTGAVGQGNTLFGRQVWVGLAGNQGTLTLGRQGDSMTDFVSPLTYAYNWGYFNSHPDDYDNVDYTRRVNSSIKYISPNWHGFQIGGVYGFGGVPGSITSNQVWSIGGSYALGGFSAAAAFIDGRNPNTSLYGNNASSSPTGNNMGSLGSASSPQSNPVIAGFASAASMQTVSTAATYQMSAVLLGVAYNNTRFSNLGSIASLNPLGYTGNVSFNNIEANLRGWVNPALRLGMSFDYTQRSSVGAVGGAKYEQLNLGADYFLSKATDVYLVAAMQKASGMDSTGQPAVASIAGLTPSATSRQLIFALGMRHLF
jgi:predicted porin